MRIGIDARLIGETGVGRYIRNLIRELSALDNENTYVVYLTAEGYKGFVAPNGHFEKRLADVRWHTFTEQVVMPFLFLKDRLDIVHIPYFNVPVLYPKRYVVTIHDLTILHVATGKASTLPYPLYLLRRLGFHIVLKLGLIRASAVIAVSESTKREILAYAHIPEPRISVTYEGVDGALAAGSQEIAKNERGRIDALVPYFLYVGNAYPHKNLELLVAAFDNLFAKGKPYGGMRLVLVGKDDFFYRRLRETVKSLVSAGNIVFYGPAGDAELAALYKGAKALVFPSRMEGFGLPPLEAVSFGCPLIVSDIPVFHEILDAIPAYVSATNVGDWTEAMAMAVRGEGKAVAPEGKSVSSLLSRYRWDRMATETLAVYRHAFTR